jgi:hypothetical protein
MTPFSLVRDPERPEPAYAASVSAIEDSICHPLCECVDCETGYYAAEEQYQPALSYRRRLSDDDAKGIAHSYVKQSNEARERLVERLRSHADVFMSRWKKRSQDKRQALLKDAAPNLEEKQWILARYSYMHERKLIHSRSQSRRCRLLLPWLNVEVLKANPAVLFALLHYRTVYPPQDWAAFDCRQLTLSWACGWLDVDYSAKCVVMYGPRYGDLMDWEAEAAHRADILGFPRARLVLEAQAYLMEVLCNVVDKILDGVDESQPARIEKWRELTTASGFKRTGEVEFWSRYTNQAFSAPPLLDIGYLLSLAETRLDAMGDHLWSLQCDVAYMRRHIKILFNTEIYRRTQITEAGKLLASDICMEVFSYYWWRWIEIECRHIEQVHKRFRDSTYPGQPLPVSYDRALGALELLLVNQVIYRTESLEELLPFTPGLSKYWSLQRNADLPQGTARLTRNTPTNTKESLTEDPLDWCLIQMLGRPDEQTHFDHDMLFAFLQNHLSTASSKEKARLDEVIYQKLSDISTCHEMLVSVRLHRPQNRARVLEEAIESENREGWKRLRSESPSLSTEALQNVGSALVEDFYREKAPSGPRNIAWLRRSQVIRAALEKFWASIREIIRLGFDGSAFSPQEIDTLLEITSANWSPRYLDAVRSEEEMVLANTESTDKPPPTQFLHEAESGRKSKLAVASPQPKTKTRAEKPPNEVHTHAERPDPDPESHEAMGAIILVTRRAFDIFALMFPCKQEASRSVDWDSFVHAMTDVGFTARNNGGSAVLFERNSQLGGKIVFHKPHPIAKIDPVMLRSMGKRMAKWFGWSREVFTTTL